MSLGYNMEHLPKTLSKFLFLFLSFITLQYIETYVTYTQAVMTVKGTVNAPKMSRLEHAFSADADFSISMSITVFFT